MIALIDYGSGNIRSVQNALRANGADVRLVNSREELAEARGMILPGVGAFGDCVHGLQSRALWDPVLEWLDSGKPFLGICVGLQLLFEESEETPGVRGLGYFKGKVRKFATPGLKVPQIGWNKLDLRAPGDRLWQGLAPETHVYFVHSYYAAPEDGSIVTASAEYGEVFAAGVGRDNVSAVQFHPEKSQEAGLRILGNFVASLS